MREGLPSTLLFFRTLYSIPRACQMDSLWSVRILSPPSYSLEADKTGSFTLTSDWPESCFSKQQCRGCLALTSNELDIYTFHTDKSVPIHMEGPYTHRYRIHTMCTKLLQLHDSKGILFILMHNGKMALIIVGLCICFTQKINRKGLPKVCVLLWFVES